MRGSAPARRGDARRGWFAGEAPDFRRRGLWLVLAFGAMSVAVLGRLFQVQVLQVETGQLAPPQTQVEGQAQDRPIPGRLGILPLLQGSE